MARVALILLLTFNAISASAATREPWPALVAALERGYRPGIEELPRLAAALADAPDEVLIAWDRQGRFLLHAVGNSHEVTLPRDLARELKGSVAIHNHPGGLPPSPRDLDTVLRYRLRRLYVAARVNGVVSLTDIGRAEAMQGLPVGGVSQALIVWRPVVEPPPALPIQGPETVASQIAYSLLGAWL